MRRQLNISTGFIWENTYEGDPQQIGYRYRRLVEEYQEAGRVGKIFVVGWLLRR
jgi:hypothetical protein